MDLHRPPKGNPPSRDLHAERWQLGFLALAVTYIFAAVLVLQGIATWLIDALAPQWKTTDWYVAVVSNTCMYLAMPLSLFLFRSASAEPPRKTKKMSALAFLGLIAICFSFSSLGNLLGAAVNNVISAITGKEAVNELEQSTLNSPFWATLLYAGILAPIMEEIFYRKLLIDRLRRYGDLPAILISGAVFGLIHGNFNQFFYAAGMGCLFGYVYLYTGKLRYTVALHASINLVSGVGLSEILKHLDLNALKESTAQVLEQTPIPAVLFLLYNFFLGICFVAAPVAIALLWRFLHFEKADRPLTASEWRAVLLKNPAVWGFAAMVVLLFVL